MAKIRNGNVHKYISDLVSEAFRKQYEKDEPAENLENPAQSGESEKSNVESTPGEPLP